MTKEKGGHVLKDQLGQMTGRAKTEENRGGDGMERDPWLGGGLSLEMSFKF